MKQIIVKSKTHGDKFAIVDDEDFDILSQYTWWRGGTGKKYAMTTIYIGHNIKKHHSMQRMVMNYPVGLNVDHIDGDTLNNQKKNLRVCTQAQNICNRSIQLNNKTGFKGVYFQKRLKKFRAVISVNCRSKHLGVFEDEMDAARCYNDAAIKYYGEFAKLNDLCAAQ